MSRMPRNIGTPIAGFALAARRWGNLHFLSFHRTHEEAVAASRMRVDNHPLEVAEARIVYAANGNVLWWDVVDPREVPSVDALTQRLVPRRAARRNGGFFDHSSGSWDMRTTQQRAYRIRLRLLGARAPLTSEFSETPVRWNSYHC